MGEPEIILEEVSPHRNLRATLEQDERVAHLYVSAMENEEFEAKFPSKSCWVRNLQRAPATLDVAGMREGLPPMMPREHCAHPAGAPALEPGELRLVWFPEGEGVALMDAEGFLAVIPAWSGQGGFYGYARDCRGEGPLAWELEEPSGMIARIQAAEAFDAAWLAEPSPWPECQDSFMRLYENALGEHSVYYAIDRNEWPPKALARFDREERVYLLSLGVSLRPQPQVEMFYEDPADYRGIELAACLDASLGEEAVKDMANYLGANSDLPWWQFTFLGAGHTIGCAELAYMPGMEAFDAFILVENPPDAPDLLVPRRDGEKVSLLWAIPITAAERAYAKEHRAAALLERFASGPSCVIRPRAGVV